MDVPVGHLTLVAHDTEHGERLVAPLSGQGHLVVVAERPDEGKYSQLPDVTDVVVVIGTARQGRSAAQSLRHAGVDASILIVGAGNEADRIAGLQAGADDYVTIPYHPDELFARIRALLRHRRYRSR